MRSSALADQAVRSGLASRAELDEIAAGWLEWLVQPDGWFTVSHVEIIGGVT